MALVVYEFAQTHRNSPRPTYAKRCGIGAKPRMTLFDGPLVVEYTATLLPCGVFVAGFGLDETAAGKRQVAPGAADWAAVPVRVGGWVRSPRSGAIRR